MNNQINLDEFCCQASAFNGEQICGTAAEVHVWFALEYVEPWGVKALPESRLSAEVKAYLVDVSKTYPYTRVQFIKQASAAARKQAETDQAWRLFIGVSKTSDDSAPTVYKFELNTYEELLSFNLGDVIAGDSAYDANRHDEPLFLVCTNGKRDRCCAKWGIPIYNAMSDYAGSQVWETTHIGGHRFAPTLVCLPHGIVYGRVELDDARAIVDNSRQGQLLNLVYYRGNGTYNSAAQMAEYYLRKQTGNLMLGHYQLKDVHNSEVQDGDTHNSTISHEAARSPVWRIGFTEKGDGTEKPSHHQVTLAQSMSSFTTIGSCEKPATSVPQYELLEIATI